MLPKGLFWIILGAVTVCVIITLSITLRTTESEWCISALNAGTCEWYHEDEKCYCVDTFRDKNVTVTEELEEDIYQISILQCGHLGGVLATPDQTELLKMLGKRMFQTNADAAIVALRKINSKWYWLKENQNQQEAIDIFWRTEFAADPDHQQGMLTVETVKKQINDDTYDDLYNYYNYDFYIENDKTYQWFGFRTTDQKFNPEGYYICKYDIDDQLISSSSQDPHDDEENGEDTSPEISDPCDCSGTDIILANLDDSQTIHSPQYPKNYCSDTNCRWLVTAPEGFGVQLDWLVFSLELEMDYVYILDGLDPLSPVIKECTGWKCGNQRSSTNKIQIHFKSDHVTTDLGFRARVTAVALDACYCSQSLTIDLTNLRESYSVNSPNFPGKYCELHNCQWTFVVPPTLGVHVTFKNFDLAPNHNDFVIVYDRGDMLFNCNGDSCPDGISSSNEMSLGFSTDLSESTNTGFQAIITVVENYCLQKDLRSEKRNRTEEAALIKDEFVSDIRDDGLVPVGANATLICGNNSKIQGSYEVTFDSVTCESPHWNREIGICVTVCNVEFSNVAQNYEDMKVCKSGDTDKPPRIVGSEESLTVHHYDFIHQKEVYERVYTCNGNQWTDGINNYPSIECENLQGDPKILILGGTATDDNINEEKMCTNTMELYCPTNTSLNKILSTKMITRRYYHTSAMIADGSVISCGNKADCERYIPRENKVYKSEPLNTQREMAALAVLNGVLFICGGQVINYSPKRHSSCEQYTPGVGWEYISPMKYVRRSPCLVAYDHKLIALGSWETNAVEAYNPVTDNWSQFPKLIHIRDAPAAAVLNDKIFVCGGAVYDARFSSFSLSLDDELKSCEQYDQTETKWVVAPEMNRARTYFQMITMGSQIFAVSGDDEHSLVTVEMFNGYEWIIQETEQTKLLRKLYFKSAVLIP